MPYIHGVQLVQNLDSQHVSRHSTTRPWAETRLYMFQTSIQRKICITWRFWIHQVYDFRCVSNLLSLFFSLRPPALTGKPESACAQDCDSSPWSADPGRTTTRASEEDPPGKASRAPGRNTCKWLVPSRAVTDWWLVCAPCRFRFVPSQSLEQGQLSIKQIWPDLSHQPPPKEARGFLFLQVPAANDPIGPTPFVACFRGDRNASIRAPGHTTRNKDATNGATGIATRTERARTRPTHLVLWNPSARPRSRRSKRRHSAWACWCARTCASGRGKRWMKWWEHHGRQEEATREIVMETCFGRFWKIMDPLWSTWMLMDFCTVDFQPLQTPPPNHWGPGPPTTVHRSVPRGFSGPTAQMGGSSSRIFQGPGPPGPWKHDVVLHGLQWSTNGLSWSKRESLQIGGRFLGRIIVENELRIFHLSVLQCLNVF